MDVSRINEEFPQGRTIPKPPPFPVASTTDYLYENRFEARKFTTKRHRSNITATKNMWDCLFDEGYRADVSIHTDNGGIIYAHASILRVKERVRKINERKVYMQLYEAMEALVHICKDGCQTIGPYDKVLKKDQTPCKYGEICKGLELLIRHFVGCKMRVSGGCIHCTRMWQVLELHSRLCVDSDVCRVPLCRNFKQRARKQNKKDDIKWKILVRKIVRSKTISGFPFFSLGSS